MSRRIPLGAGGAGAVLALVAALLAGLLLLLAILNTPPPKIDLVYGETSIRLAADRAWTLFPGDCVNLSWELEGIKTLYIEREGKIGWGEMAYCPGISADGPRIEVTAQNGIYRRLNLQINHLPALLLYVAGFVGLLGPFPMAAYFLWARRAERPPPLYWIVIGAICLAAVGAWLRLRPAAPPLIDVDEGDVAARLWAEQDLIVFPHECVDVGWSVAGAESLTVNGDNYDHSRLRGETRHCPEDGDRVLLEARSEAGAVYSYSLHLPSLFPAAPSRPYLQIWGLFGLLLGALVFLPLTARSLKLGWRSRQYADFAAVGAFAAFVLLLYLPFGFDSIGHWEEWHVFAYYEGGPFFVFAAENASRFLSTLPHALAYLISSESFVGYHLAHFALFVGKMVLFYGILRQLRVMPLYAFLTAVMFMVYPVNSALMSLRSLPLNFSICSLLAAVYFMLEYIKRPDRLALAALWLALLYNVASNETGYAVILVAPLLWWLRCRRFSWRNLNLTAIWYIVPAFKLALLLLLQLTNRGYYRGPGFDAAAGSQEAAASIPEMLLQLLSAVYRHAFFDGWRDALATLGQNDWWSATLVALLMVAAVGWHLSRNGASEQAPDLRRSALWLIGGLLFVIPAVGVLMWIPFYHGDLWRLYFYVPLGAAAAVLGALLILTNSIRAPRRRQAAALAICLLLMLPAISRLFAQHQQYVQSANNKARILYGVLEKAPAVAPSAKIVITTDMGPPELSAAGIFEFVHQKMANIVFYLLYEDSRPASASFCQRKIICGLPDGLYKRFDAADLADLLPQALVFRLNPDLSVDLIEDPAAYFGLKTDETYDASGLYDPDAPLPPRALTMLGAALRD